MKTTPFEARASTSSSPEAKSDSVSFIQFQNLTIRIFYINRYIFSQNSQITYLLI